jgi:hypothetical protein
MKVRVLRLIEYEFDSAEDAEKHLTEMTHSLNIGTMRMRSAVLRTNRILPDYDDTARPTVRLKLRSKSTSRWIKDLESSWGSGK